MPRTSTDGGLMRAILNVIYRLGQAESYDTDSITAQVKTDGFWDGGPEPQTPERSINMYCSQSPDLFEKVGSNRYRLRPEHFRIPILPVQLDAPEEGSTTPRQIQQTTFRTLRQTKLIQQLKLIHANRCQLCGTTLEIKHGEYSEGHHIRPLGHKGPDIASNILILCPNHHVLCDYGGIKLSLANIRLDPRHAVSQEYIDWHNHHYFET